MSLVNDMLRDLDARRRDAPTRGPGAEKLVPAAEQGGRSGRQRQTMWLPALLVLILAGALLVFMLTRNGDDMTPVPVDPAAQLSAQAAATQPESVPPQINSTDYSGTGAGIVGRGGPAEERETLAQLQARLENLEAQNQALLQAQDSVEANSIPNPVSGSASSSDSGWPARDWDQNRAEAPQLPGDPVAPAFLQSEAELETTPSVQAAATNSSTAAASLPVSPDGSDAASSSRSPRELSFQDSDRQQVQQALRQWSSGQQLSALQTLDSFTYTNPEAHQSRETLAKLLIEQGEAERAMQAVELGLGIAPRHDGYRKIKARLLLAEGNAAQAERLLSTSVPAVAADTEFHDLLATAYLSGENYDSARITYQTLLQQNQDVGRWWYGLGVTFDAAGRTADAAGAYQRALQSSDLPAPLRQRSQQRLVLLQQTDGLD